MPAHRSDAEGEIREAVVARLREIMPGCRIIHEINASGQGSNRIDVLAVGQRDLAAVEIKSAKDKLDRLPDQIAAMRGVARRVYVALHEKFLRQGQYDSGKWYPPDMARDAITWVYPKAPRQGHVHCGETWLSVDGWARPPQLRQGLPAGALALLWRDELHAACGRLRVACSRRATMEEAIDALRWHCTGREITEAVCLALRTRDCCEADPPHIQSETAA